MSAAEALRLAHAAGVKLSVEKDDLLLDAPSEPPSAVLQMLRQHKTGVLELLRRGLRVHHCGTDPVERWRRRHDEPLAS